MPDTCGTRRAAALTVPLRKPLVIALCALAAGSCIVERQPRHVAATVTFDGTLYDGVTPVAGRTVGAAGALRTPDACEGVSVMADTDAAGRFAFEATIEPAFGDVPVEPPPAPVFHATLCLLEDARWTTLYRESFRGRPPETLQITCDVSAPIDDRCRRMIEGLK